MSTAKSDHSSCGHSPHVGYPRPKNVNGHEDKSRLSHRHYRSARPSRRPQRLARSRPGPPRHRRPHRSRGLPPSRPRHAADGGRRAVGLRAARPSPCARPTSIAPSPCPVTSSIVATPGAPCASARTSASCPAAALRRRRPHRRPHRRPCCPACRRSPALARQRRVRPRPAPFARAQRRSPAPFRPHASPPIVTPEGGFLHILYWART